MKGFTHTIIHNRFRSAAWLHKNIFKIIMSHCDTLFCTTTILVPQKAQPTTKHDQHELKLTNMYKNHSPYHTLINQYTGSIQRRTNDEGFE